LNDIDYRIVCDYYTIMQPNKYVYIRAILNILIDVMAVFTSNSNLQESVRRLTFLIAEISD